MNGWIVLGVVAVVVLVLVGVYLSMTAGRLDHLHHRIDTSKLVLDTQLLRRSSVALELSGSGLLDPASSLLIGESAHDARSATDAELNERALAESDLTAALVGALGPEEVAEVGEVPAGAAMLTELDAACRRVELSRRFHNDGVRACRQLRRQRMVRLFRLAGHTPLPQSWEMDDSLPGPLAAR